MDTSEVKSDWIRPVQFRPPPRAYPQRELTELLAMVWDALEPVSDHVSDMITGIPRPPVPT